MAAAAGSREAGRPFLVRRADAEPIGLAGLWEPWLGADGSEIETACILTLPANGSLAAVHERMPAIVDPRTFEAWLDCDDVGPAEAAGLLAPVPDGLLEMVEIGPAINH